jgi:hypothetical protein
MKQSKPQRRALRPKRTGLPEPYLETFGAVSSDERNYLHADIRALANFARACLRDGYTEARGGRPVSPRRWSEPHRRLYAALGFIVRAPRSRGRPPKGRSAFEQFFAWLEPVLPSGTGDLFDVRNRFLADATMRLRPERSLFSNERRAFAAAVHEITRAGDPPLTARHEEYVLIADDADDRSSDLYATRRPPKAFRHISRRLVWPEAHSRLLYLTVQIARGTTTLEAERRAVEARVATLLVDGASWNEVALREPAYVKRRRKRGTKKGTKKGELSRLDDAIRDVQVSRDAFAARRAQHSLLTAVVRLLRLLLDQRIGEAPAR